METALAGEQSTAGCVQGAGLGREKSASWQVGLYLQMLGSHRGPEKGSGVVRFLLSKVPMAAERAWTDRFKSGVKQGLVIDVKWASVSPGQRAMSRLASTGLSRGVWRRAGT